MKTPEESTGNDSVLSVRTVNSEGEAPKRRVASPSAAASAYWQAQNNNIRRDARFGDIQGIYNGFPPTPPATLERNGMSDLPNLNLKQFRGKVDTFVSTWTALAAQGDGWTEVQCDYPEDPMECQRRSKVLTEEFNMAIRDWDNEDFGNGNQYVLETAARDTQMGLFGLGLCFFTDSIDFRFRMIPTRRVLVPEGTRLCLDNCPAMFIIDTISVTQLYGKRKQSGWNEKAILRNLYDRVELRAGTTREFYSYGEWINQIRNNDLASRTLSDFMTIRIIHMFVQEFDGTITQMTFTEDYGKCVYDGKDKAEYDSDGGSFIYEKTNVATRWQQIIIPFADNAGPECDYHGVKGFGDMIFDGCHLNNLMFNRAATGAVLANTLMFKGQGENDAQKLDQITLTHLGLMPAGLELEQVKFAGDVEAALSIVGYGSQVISENTRISPQNDKTTTGEQPTATQVNADRADRAQFTTLQIAIYRAVGLDVQFGEMYRRIAQPGSKYPESWGGGKVAKRFRDRCKERGIPEKDLLKVKTVRANRNIGSGDMSLDYWKAQQLLGIATPGKGQFNARREAAIALKGIENVDAYVEPQPEPGPQDAEISQENAFIQLGQPPMAFGWQDQEKHVTDHLALLSQAAQVASQIQDQGINPQNLEGAKKLSNLLAAGISHVGQHIALMGEVRSVDKRHPMHEQFIKETLKQVNNLSQIETALTEDIAKADPQQQPQMTPEMAKAQQEMQIRQAQADQEMQIKDAAAKQKLGTLAITTQARTDAAEHKHMQQLQADAARTQQELATKDLHTSQEMLTAHAQSQQDLNEQAAMTQQKIEDDKKKAAAKPKPEKPKKK